MAVFQQKGKGPPPPDGPRGLLLDGHIRRAEALLAHKAQGGPLTTDDWLLWIRLACMMGERDKAVQRFDMACRQHGRARLAFVEAELNTRLFHYEAAAKLLSDALPRVPQGAFRDLSEVLIKVLRRRQATAAAYATATDADRPDFPVYCINLDRQPDKMDRVAHEFGQLGIMPERVPGVLGMAIADALIPRFGTGVSPGLKGTLGCFLSNFAVWERFHATGQPACLILEDDARPLLRLPRRLATYGLPAGFDVCFVTSGFAEGIADTRDAGQAPLAFLPVEEAVEAGQATLRAPATYGYFLSRAGAARLMERCLADGFFGDVDWRIVAYCTSPAILQRLKPGTFTRKALEAHYRVIAPRPPLAGYAADLGLIAQEGTGSVRVSHNLISDAHEVFGTEAAAV